MLIKMISVEGTDSSKRDYYHDDNNDQHNYHGDLTIMMMTVPKMKGGRGLVMRMAVNSLIAMREMLKLVMMTSVNYQGGENGDC